MLDQHHLEQHHRIDAGAPIILTIERLHHFIQTCEVHRCIYLSQQMLLRHQLVYDYELYQISIHFPAFQHLASPLPILPYLSEKAQLQPDFFDELKRRPAGLRFLFIAAVTVRIAGGKGVFVHEVRHAVCGRRLSRDPRRRSCAGRAPARRARQRDFRAPPFPSPAD